MIRRIRRRHKIIWLILAITLPGLFIAAIALRHREAINERIPKQFTRDTETRRK